jgi:hypothetical protein
VTSPSRRWPAWLLLLGLCGLLPQAPVRRAEAWLDEALLSLRGVLDPGSWLLRARGEASAAELLTAGEAGELQELARLLEAAHARVLPPRAEGWQRDGRFAAVPIGRLRTPAALALAVSSPLPPDEPAFHGRELVGFTSRKSDESPRVVPILSKGTRIPACAGVPGQRETRFLALGDGSDRMRVAYADADVPLVEGDLAWAIDVATPESPPIGGALARVIGGARLGRIVRGDAPTGGDRPDWRVEPLSSLSTLAEVAIRLPPGFPAPAELSLLPVAVAARRAPPLDPRRDGILLPLGRESGVVAGCAIAAGPLFVGRVSRAGYRHALALTLRDPGLRCRVLLLRQGETIAWELESAGADGDEIALAGAPAPADCESALVVSAPSVDGTPEGLLLGTLVRRGGRLLLRPAARAFADVVVHRPPGEWSDG